MAPQLPPQQHPQPTTTQICSNLRQTIWYHLDNDLLDNALFLAGRLHAIDPRNADSVHLLALCHFRQRQLKATYDYCRTLALKREHLGCSYVFAQACLGLERFGDGVAALERARVLWEGKDAFAKSIDVPRRQSLDAAAFHCLLGKLLHGSGDVKRAVDCYVSALKLNPYMWDAFERLCDTGATIRPANIFKDHKLAAALLHGTESKHLTVPGETASANTAHPQAQQGQLRHTNPLDSLTTPGGDPFNPAKPAASETGLTIGEVNAPGRLGTRPAQSNLHSTSSIHSSAETPPATSQDDNVVLGPIHHTRNTQMEPPNAPLRKPRTQPATSDSQTLVEAGVKPRQTVRSRTKEQTNASEAQEAPRVVPPSSTNHGKRTISGTAAYHPSSTTLDPVAAPQRRSTRLNKKTSTTFTIPGGRDVQEPRKARATGTRGRAAAGTTVGRVVSGNRKPMEQVDQGGKEYRNAVSKVDVPQAAAPKPTPAVNEISQRDSGASKYVLDLLCKLGSGCYALSRYQCQQAIQCFTSIPPAQRETPWVLAQIGRAQFEQTEHVQAEKTFARLRKMAPSRIEDMETYSTLLWHLKSDLDLAFLSHELIETDRSSPEAWCTIGNSFSLQRDHEQALKCFKRATQLRPKFAYGYTLQGHEYVANEDYDKALLSYRKAIGANSRHYNGWYGIGRVYERLGKYDMAEKHYRAAAAINPSNSILVCNIGTVLDKQGNHKAALQQYNHACILSPQSAMTRFRRARTLLRLRLYRDALAEFIVLKDMAPDEANVHFMLGRTYKMLGDRGSAVRHLTIALNLDPKAAPLIKDAMEALGDDDISDEADDDEVME